MMAKKDEAATVWVRHKATGTVFLAGLANVPELGDDYETVKSPGDPTPVSVKGKVKDAVQAQEETAEAEAEAG